jgi:methyltransferase (TIGR00027 family)
VAEEIGGAARGEADRLSGVGLTAVGVAWARAVESRRPDRLFDDPLAARVAQRGQQGLEESFGVREGGRAQTSPVDEQVARAFLDYAAVRTRYFDDCLLEACAGGCRQVVILAAGMDARAFRLPWAAGIRIYELDRRDVLAVKEEVIAAEGVSPRCQRHSVATDLTADWAAELRAAGFSGSQQTAWLAEGLLNYLTPENNDALVATVGQLSGIGSTLALEVIRASAISDGPMTETADRMASFGAPWRSGIDDPAGWLAGHGWHARVDNPFEIAARYGRSLTGWPGASPTDEPTGWLLTAARDISGSRVR